jgi:Xaa-Pro aminopeptidase
MELSSDWTLMRSGLPDVPTPQKFLSSLPGGSRVGYDPSVHAAEATLALEKALGAANISLCPLSANQRNPIDEVWCDSRPAKPMSALREHPLRVAGQLASEKLGIVRQKMAEKGAKAMVLSALDEIAWLLNFRASDVECNPVSLCYALVEEGAARASCAEKKRKCYYCSIELTF